MYSTNKRMLSTNMAMFYTNKGMLSTNKRTLSTNITVVCTNTIKLKELTVNYCTKANKICGLKFMGSKTKVGLNKVVV